MNYAEIINNTTLRDGVVKASSSPFKAELLHIIEETINWLSQEPDFLDDDFINWTTQWLEQIGTDQFEILVRDYQVAISELVNASNKKEGNFINSKTSELLDEEYVTAASAAICSIKLCLDMLEEGTTDHKCYVQIKVISSQVLWLDTILKTLMYSEWRSEKETIARSNHTAINDYLLKAAKDILVTNRMHHVSQGLIAELVFSQLNLISNSWPEYDIKPNTIALFDVDRTIGIDGNEEEQEEDIIQRHERRLNKNYGTSGWKLYRDEEQDVYLLLVNTTLKERLIDKTKAINAFKKAISESDIYKSVKSVLSVKRQQAIVDLSRYAKMNYCNDNKFFYL